MGSTRGGVGFPDEAMRSGTADLLAAAASLRWARPDLTAALADHTLDAAAADCDRDRWLAAAGWAVHARSATGDGREVASEVLDGLVRWGTAPLAGAAAYRLRVELAVVAVEVGAVDAARMLLEPVVAGYVSPELRADMFCALARCAVEDAPGEVAVALRSAEAAWTEAGSPSDIGVSVVALVAAAAQRRAGCVDAAIDRAADGLARLDRAQGRPVAAGTPSGYVAAALAAEWISALLDAGRIDEAREGCVPLTLRLTEPIRPSRQLARLRLTMVRVGATGASSQRTVAALERAARDAADSDAPDLESLCRSALGALHEEAGRLDAAIEALRLGVLAGRRDRARDDRFRAALATVAPTGSVAGLPGRAARPAGRRADPRSPGERDPECGREPVRGDVRRAPEAPAVERQDAEPVVASSESPTPTTPEPGGVDAEGCVVAIDVAHDQTLPVLLTGLELEDDLPGTQLRAAVHDAAGPVGDQLLHRLDHAQAGQHDAEPATVLRVPTQHDQCAVPGSDDAAEQATVPDAASELGPEPAPDPAAAPTGRHDAAGRTPFQVQGLEVRPGSGGRRHRCGSENRPPAEEPVPAEPVSTEPVSTDELSLAELLAGALAAYRGI